MVLCRLWCAYGKLVDRDFSGRDRGNCRAVERGAVTFHAALACGDGRPHGTGASGPDNEVVECGQW